MRLFKMLAYALMGYAIYEFVRGMAEDPQERRPVSSRPPQPVSRPRSGNASGNAARGAAAAS